MTIRRILASLVVCAAFSALAAPGDGRADDFGPVYIEGAAGLSLPTGFDGSLTRADPTFDFSDTYESGYAMRAAGGVILFNDFRAEIEIAHRRNGFPDSTSSNAGSLDTEGKVSMTSVMLNGLYDFPIFDSGFSVYAGGGVGIASLGVDLRRGAGSPGFTLSNAADKRFAWQLRAGAEYDFYGRFTGFMDYTYFSAVDDDMTGFNGAVGLTQQAFGYSNHSVMLGVRYTFE